MCGSDSCYPCSMLMKLQSNFFFRKRILKKKQLISQKTIKIVKKKILKRTFINRRRRAKKPFRVIKFRRLFSNGTRTLLSSPIKKILRKKFSIKRRLKIFSKRRFTRVYNRAFLGSRNTTLNPAKFLFKWVLKPTTKNFGRLPVLNYVSHLSNKSVFQVYQLHADMTSNSIITNFLVMANTWLVLDRNFFKNQSLINNTLLLSAKLVYRPNFFSVNKYTLLKFTTDVARSSTNSEMKSIAPTSLDQLPKVRRNYPKVLKVFLKYLPHTSLTRFYRRTKKRKIVAYNIDMLDFFNLNLLRVNQDSKAYRMASARISNSPLDNVSRGISKLLNVRKTDRVIRTKIDLNTSLLSNLNPFKNSFLRLKKRNLLSLTKSPLIDASQKNLNTGIASNTILTRNLNFSSEIFTNPTLYKYLVYNNNLLQFKYSSNSNKNTNMALLNSLNKTLFNSRDNFFSKSNILPVSIFKYSIKRRLLKIINFHKFSINVTMWYYNILIRFMENCSGKKVYLKFNPFIENSLPFSDVARCQMWSTRVTGFQRILGPKIFLNESLKILHIAIRFKDPTFLSNWIKGMLYRMSFWKYRLLFRYLKYTLRYLFFLYFPELEFKGFKLRLKGKISVAGNARTRTLMYKIGETSYSKLNNRIVSDFTTINTFTGVLGFKIWFFF